MNGIAQAKPYVWWRTMAAVGVVIMLWALFGIVTRPVGQLASFWPANAVLMGLFVRLPALAGPAGWIGALLGYVAADLLTGSTLIKSLLLTSANLVGVSTGYLLYRHLAPGYTNLTRPMSVMVMVLILSAASVLCGIVGSFAGHYLFGLSYRDAFLFWSISELVNYVAIIPVMLALPLPSVGSGSPSRRLHEWRQAFKGGKVGPFIAVILCAIAALFVGGPGAISFPVPALLWVAVTCSVLVNAIMALLFTAWTLISIAKGFFPLPIDPNDLYQVLSLRIGVMMMALAPLVVASVMASRNELLEKFQSLATTDYLTGLQNRSGFYSRAGDMLVQRRAQPTPTSVLMADIDHFKMINDTYGHQAGDRVLQAVATALNGQIRSHDLLGRVGGEEFCLFLDDTDMKAAEQIADRLCRAVRELRIPMPGGHVVSPTISIGIASADWPPEDLPDFIAVADRALYQAKYAGRDRYMAIEHDDSLTPLPGEDADPE